MRINKTGFVEIYRGATMNKDLLVGTKQDGPKYFVTDVYGSEWEITRGRYHEIRRALGEE
mgnify:CR=1 FL=1